MNQFPNQIAGACIDLGAEILAVHGTVESYGQEIVVDFKGRHHFRLNQHFYVSYLLRDGENADEAVSYIQPCLHALVRSVRKIIAGGAMAKCAKPEDVAGDLAFLDDNYEFQHARKIKLVGSRIQDLNDRLIAIDDVPYTIIQTYNADGGANVLLDRPLDQPVTITSKVTGGRVDTHRSFLQVLPGGVLVVAPRYADKEVPGDTLRENIERHGINVRHSRHRRADEEATQVTFDVMVGLKFDPSLCRFTPARA